MQEPRFLAADEHATAFTMETMWTANVEGIPTVHRYSIRVIANEPAKCWLSVSCRLDIDNMRQRQHRGVAPGAGSCPSQGAGQERALEICVAYVTCRRSSRSVTNAHYASVDYRLDAMMVRGPSGVLAKGAPQLFASSEGPNLIG